MKKNNILKIKSSKFKIDLNVTSADTCEHYNILSILNKKT